MSLNLLLRAQHDKLRRELKNRCRLVAIDAAIRVIRSMELWSDSLTFSQAFLVSNPNSSLCDEMFSFL